MLDPRTSAVQKPGESDTTQCMAALARSAFTKAGSMTGAPQQPGRLHGCTGREGQRALT